MDLDFGGLQLSPQGLQAGSPSPSKDASTVQRPASLTEPKAAESSVLSRIARVPTVSKIFFCMIWLQAILSLIFRILKFQQLSNCQSSNVDEQRWILALAVVFIIFVLYFGMNAVVREKTVELVAFIIAAILQLLRTTYEYIIFANDESVSSLNRGDIVVNSLFVALYIPLVFFVKKTFGWLFFRVVGGDMQMRSLYLYFEVFVSVQKFSVLITLIFCLTALVFLFRDDAEQAGVSILFILSIACAKFGVESVKRENRTWSVIYGCCQIIVPIFSIWTYGRFADHTTELGGLGYRVGLNEYSLSFSCDGRMFFGSSLSSPQQITTCLNKLDPSAYFTCRTENVIIKQQDLKAKLFDGAVSCTPFADALYNNRVPPADLAKYAVCNLQLAKIATSEKTMWIKGISRDKCFASPFSPVSPDIVENGFGCLPVVNAVSNKFWQLLLALVIIIHFASICCLYKVMRYFDLGLKKVHGIESKVQKQLRVDNSSESGAGYYGRASLSSGKSTDLNQI